VNIFSTRKATLLDAKIIAQMASELGYPTTEKQCHSRLKALLQIPEHRIYVACDALSIPVGWIHVFISYSIESDPFAEIGGLVVAEDYRKNGLGSMLINEVEQWVKKSGLKKLRVRHRTERQEARPFYERCGFSLSKQQNVLDKIISGNI